jgi:hypothetical protein
VEVRCTQCGAELEVAADARLLRCGFCDTALVVDGDATLFHEVLVPTVAVEDVPGHLRRFFASSAVAADVEKQAVVDAPQLEFFPFWAFTVTGGGGERVILEPAAPSALQGLQGLSLPAGAARAMSDDVTHGHLVVEPEVPPATARSWLLDREPGVEARRTVLTHVPLYRVTYGWRGRRWRAAVDGVSGRVFPAEFPARAETPFRAVAVTALVVFGLEGLLISNPLLKIAVYLVSALPLLGVAWWTSRSA